MTNTVCEQCGKGGLLQCGHSDVLDSILYDLSERLRRRAELLEADCRIYDADDIIEVADKLRALSPLSGEPASVAGESDYKRGIYAAKCWLRDQQHKNPPDSLWHAAVILADRMDVALLSPSGEPASVAGKAESAWLIERTDISTIESDNRICLHYYAEWGNGKHYWTPDHLKAKRFPTMDAAKAETNGDPLLTVVEHMWVSAALSKPTPVEAGLREAEEWLAEFGSMSDGKGSACARIMRNLLAALSETRLDAS